MAMQNRVGLPILLTLIMAGACELPDPAALDKAECPDGEVCETSILCGNGTQDEGETCDDGNQVTETCAYGETACVICDATCTTAEGTTSFCGDNFVDTENGETCDDGNTAGGDGCASNCRLPGCGDGHVDTDEECDDGNAINSDSCTNLCTIPRCGDGIISDTTDSSNGDAPYVETCDDGNALTEICDYGETSCSVCDETCNQVPGATSYCGDGNADVLNGEACDNGDANSDITPDACRVNCQTRFAQMVSLIPVKNVTSVWITRMSLPVMMNVNRPPIFSTIPIRFEQMIHFRF